MEKSTLQDFPLHAVDKIRYSDTDRQGHVNNAVFATFLETGRVNIIYNPDFPILAAGASFVIASLQLNFLREINWPGQVEIGTGIAKVGNSSIRLVQHIFQNDQCVATSESVIVQVDDETGSSLALTAGARETLEKWMVD
ncbi:MAG: thioesterase family protein [Bacteroidota bacterium]